MTAVVRSCSSLCVLLVPISEDHAISRFYGKVADPWMPRHDVQSRWIVLWFIHTYRFHPTAEQYFFHVGPDLVQGWFIENLLEIPRVLGSIEGIICNEIEVDLDFLQRSDILL